MTFTSFKLPFINNQLSVDSSVLMTSWTHLASDWLVVYADIDPSLNV